MPSTQNAVNNHEYRSVPITALAESATNPRKRFDAKSLEELAASFKTQGILAPLLVRELEESKYEVVAGARRLRAAKLAELEKLPVRVVKLTDAEAIEAQCVELSIVRKSFLCRYAASARRIHLNDVPTPTFPQQCGRRRSRFSFFLASNTLISEALCCRCDERYVTRSPGRSRALEPRVGSPSHPPRQIPTVVLRAPFCRGCNGSEESPPHPAWLRQPQPIRCRSHRSTNPQSVIRPPRLKSPAVQRDSALRILGARRVAPHTLFAFAGDVAEVSFGDEIAKHRLFKQWCVAAGNRESRGHGVHKVGGDH